MSDGKKIVVRNRRAFHDYEITEKVEAGISLLGPEIKSIRAGKASINEAYASFKKGELWLLDMHVPEYENRGYVTHEPRRPRKLLLKKRELRKLDALIARQGLTIVPLQLYFVRGQAEGRDRRRTRPQAPRQARSDQGKGSAQGSARGRGQAPLAHRVDRTDSAPRWYNRELVSKRGRSVSTGREPVRCRVPRFQVASLNPGKH